MFVLKYKCKKLWDEDDFEKVDQMIKNSKQLSPNYEKSLLVSWKLLMRYLQPGKSADNSMALMITVYSEKMELSLADQDAFAKLFQDGISEVFKKKNVLSVTRDDVGEHVSCTAVVFPLDRRIANPDKFLHSVFQDQPNDKVKQVIEHHIHVKFNEVYVTGETNDGDETSRGYKPALIDFKPEPYHREYDHILYHAVPDPENQIQTVRLRKSRCLRK